MFNISPDDVLNLNDLFSLLGWLQHVELVFEWSKSEKGIALFTIIWEYITLIPISKQAWIYL